MRVMVNEQIQQNSGAAVLSSRKKNRKSLGGGGGGPPLCDRGLRLSKIHPHFVFKVIRYEILQRRNS